MSERMDKFKEKGLLGCLNESTEEGPDDKVHKKDIFVMIDTSRLNSFNYVKGFIPRAYYQSFGIYLLSDYEAGCFQLESINIRVILCGGSSMTVEQFCGLWKTIYPSKD